jgi:hypothetical protein
MAAAWLSKAKSLWDGIQLFQFTDNEECGNGMCHDQLLQLLRNLHRECSADFGLDSVSGVEHENVALGRYYLAERLKLFPAQT